MPLIEITGTVTPGHIQSNHITGTPGRFSTTLPVAEYSLPTYWVVSYTFVRGDGSTFNETRTQPSGPETLSDINNHAGQAWSIGFGSVEYFYETYINDIHMFATTSDVSKSYARRWAAMLEGGRAILAFVGLDNGLYVSSSRDIKAKITNAQSNKFWAAPYKLAAQANDVACAIHPNKGTAQIWYTRTDPVSGANSNVYVTSPTAGAMGVADWTTPTVIPANSTTQPYPGSVHSQSSGVGLGSRMGESFLRGRDGRLWGYTYYGAFACSDNGVGAKWSPGSPDTAGAHNSYDGSPPNLATFNSTGEGTNFLKNYYGGKTYNAQIDSAAPHSPVVEADDGTLYQVIWTKQVSRIAKVYPRPGTPTVTNQQINNTHVNYTSAGDFAGYDLSTGGAISLNYRVDLPAGMPPSTQAMLYFENVEFQRPPIKGKLNDTKRPTKVSFNIPQLVDVPPYNPALSSSGYSYFRNAYVLLNFTYRDAENLVVHVGKTYKPADPNDSNSVPTGDPLPAPGTVPYVFAGCSQAIEGRGEWGEQPISPPVYDKTLAILLTNDRVIDIDKARQTTITFDLELFNIKPINNLRWPGAVVDQTKAPVVGNMVWKDAWLYFTTQGNPVATGYSFVLKSAQPASSAPTASLGIAGRANEPVMGCLLSSYNAPALVNEINAAAGSSWDFDLVYTPGRDTSGFYTPFDYVQTNAYAVLTYPVDAANANNSDFFLIRSRDRGETWEFANNAKPISQLSDLRDYNRAGGNDFLMPSLVSEDGLLYVVAVKNGVPVTWASQDAGESWSAA